MEIILLMAAGVCIYYWFKKKKEREHERKQALIAKFGNKIAEKIVARKVWQGMTSEQLEESWGKPLDIDDSVLKTKTKAVWKYGYISKNRYRQKVIIENGTVIGWENK